LPFRVRLSRGRGQTVSAMLPFALVEAALGAAVQEEIRLVGCCHLRGGLVPAVRPRAKLAVTRTRRKRFDLVHAKTKLCWISALEGGGSAYVAVSGMVLRSGSYTSPVTQSRCIRTASFRATAMTAFFFAVLPPRPMSRRPWRLRSLS
jgi:hypothetical protein